jgi:hypothetical protein
MESVRGLGCGIGDGLCYGSMKGGYVARVK